MKLKYENLCITFAYPIEHNKHYLTIPRATNACVNNTLPWWQREGNSKCKSQHHKNSSHFIRKCWKAAKNPPQSLCESSPANENFLINIKEEISFGNLDITSCLALLFQFPMEMIWKLFRNRLKVNKVFPFSAQVMRHTFPIESEMTREIVEWSKRVIPWNNKEINGNFTVISCLFQHLISRTVHNIIKNYIEQFVSINNATTNYSILLGGQWNWNWN